MFQILLHSFGMASMPEQMSSVTKWFIMERSSVHRFLRSLRKSINSQQSLRSRGAKRDRHCSCQVSSQYAKHRMPGARWSRGLPNDRGAPMRRAERQDIMKVRIVRDPTGITKVNLARSRRLLEIL